MTRPLRLEYAGALYHVTSRGDRREDIYFDSQDRREWLHVLASTCKRFNWVVHAYCQMTNHYHLLVETIEGNLSEGMRQLNGVYTQKINRRHKLTGHLFQGRYEAILVQKESHLLELSRYVVLNPVRAGIVETPEDWAWSSFTTVMSDELGPVWLDCDWILAQFGSVRNNARQLYMQFVIEGVGKDSPLLAIRNQLLLGDDDFVERHQSGKKLDNLRELSIAHRRTLAMSLEEYQSKYGSRNEAMARAYKSGAYKMSQIADHFGVHYMTVSRVFKEFEKFNE